MATTPSAAGLAAPEVTPDHTGVPTFVVESRFERVVMRLWMSPVWLAPVAIALCVTASFSYVLANNPTDNKVDPIAGCLFKALTGYDCPGCGGTRMVWYLLHGNVVEAARHHLVVFLTLPFLLYSYVAWSMNRLFKTRLPLVRIPLWGVGVFLLVWLVYAVLRNIPAEPFSLFYV